MDKREKKSLEAADWKIGSAAAFIALKLRLSEELRERRAKGRLSQLELMKRIGSSQSRVAKMEASDASVSSSILKKNGEISMTRVPAVALLLSLAVFGCGHSSPETGRLESSSGTAVHDPALLEAILEDIRVGWEQGDGTPFYGHFLDWDGARYFEGGGENVGLRDLVENHVEPEAELGLQLGFSNIQPHFEGEFAWALVDTEIRLTTRDGRDIHNRGHATYLFRWVDGAWKVVHTQSASSPVRADHERTRH